MPPGQHCWAHGRMAITAGPVALAQQAPAAQSHQQHSLLQSLSLFQLCLHQQEQHQHGKREAAPQRHQELQPSQGMEGGHSASSLQATCSQPSLLFLCSVFTSATSCVKWCCELRMRALLVGWCCHCSQLGCKTGVHRCACTSLHTFQLCLSSHIPHAPASSCLCADVCAVCPVFNL